MSFLGLPQKNTIYYFGEIMNTFIRYLSIFFIGSCLLSSTSQFAQDFVVGTTSAYAPFVSLNEQGEYVGFDIDLAKELSKKLNRNLVIKDIGSLPALMIALKQGKIDAIIWAISITEDRQKRMDMIYYQGEKVVSLPLLFWKEIPQEITSLNDFVNNPKLNISVESGSFQDAFLQSVTGLNLKSVDKVMDAILEIKFKKSTATMIDPSLLNTLTTQFDELKVLSVPLPADQQSFGNGICLKKNSPLTVEVKRAISELREEKKIAELEQKWNLVGK